MAVTSVSTPNGATKSSFTTTVGATTNESTTINGCATDTDSITTSTFISTDDLSLLDTLAEGLLEGHSTGQLSIVSLVVVDKEELRLGGLGWYFDNFLLGSRRTSVEDVDKGLLFGRRHDNGANATDGILSAHKDVVEVHLGVREVAGRKSLNPYSGSGVQVEVPSYLRGNARALGATDLTIAAAVSIGDAFTSAATSSRTTSADKATTGSTTTDESTSRTTTTYETTVMRTTT